MQPAQAQQRKEYQVWVTGKGLGLSTIKARAVIEAGNLTILRSNQPILGGPINSLRVAHVGGLGVSLIEDAQGRQLRLMFNSLWGRLAIGLLPTVIFSVILIWRGLPLILGFPVFIMIMGFVAEREAKNPKRKEFYEALGAQTKVLEAAQLQDKQAEQMKPVTRSILIYTLTPIVGFILGTILYVLVYLGLEKLELISPDTSLLIKLGVWSLTYLIALVPTYFFVKWMAKISQNFVDKLMNKTVPPNES